MKRTRPTRRKPLLRKKRLSPMSLKRKRENLLYLKKRKEFLRANPYCGASEIITRYKYVKGEIAGGALGAELLAITPHRATEIHHVRGRGKYLNDESTWLAVCRASHDWIHANPIPAAELGLWDLDRNTARAMASVSPERNTGRGVE